MEEACKSVKNESMSLREAARAYNVPVETLRRRVAGVVSMDCRSGPPTILTSEEEANLAEYCVVMADMGFGLTREGVMAMAYAIVEKTGRNHPDEDGMKASCPASLYLLFVPLRLCHMLVHCVL